ncbi:MAG: formylglycine-generating enzyme family protein [Polyangiaceae bacterium]|nr:formylglycine-generating enzyme family protein [Polyangiaceae bacterium]
MGLFRSILPPLALVSRHGGGARIGPRGLALLVLGALSCRERPSDVMDDPAEPEPSTRAALDPRAPPRGMVWVPPGVLLAGTPEGRLPRQPEAEMPGAQVVLKGFFIDEYPYPNEPGAIPRTGVDREEAAALCEGQGKRLCTELEWERACKGPEQRVYAYGDQYRVAECGTGSVRPGTPPVGLLPNCRSAFGVKDLHGGVAQWTASPWGRGDSTGLVAVRGGNGEPGEVFSRCAHAVPRRPSSRGTDLGLRCCAGEPNVAEVTLNLVRGEALQGLSLREEHQKLVAQQPPAELKALMAHTKAPFRVLQSWKWRPVANEELLMQSGCAHPGPLSICGIVVHRLPPGRPPEALAFAGSGWWLPSLNDTDDPRDFYVYGGDKDGGFRRYLGYSYGRVVVGGPERNIKKKKKK